METDVAPFTRSGGDWIAGPRADDKRRLLLACAHAATAEIGATL